MSQSLEMAYQIFSDRSQYKPCRIAVPDLDRPVAAIEVNNSYYSLFQVAPDLNRAETIAQRLAQRGDDVIITAIPKGGAIWVKEINARLVTSSTNSASKSTTSSQPPAAPPYKVLNTHETYQDGYIRVPDLNNLLEAIQFQQQSYSLFKRFPDIHRASEIALRLNQKGDQVLIIPQGSEYGVWIWEPDAQWVSVL